MSPLRFDRREKHRGDIIIRVLMILVIISSLSVVNTLQIPPKVMAQAPSEQAKVLIDDAIQALNTKDIKKAQVRESVC